MSEPEDGRWTVVDYPHDGPTPVFVHGPAGLVGADVSFAGPRAEEAKRALVALINERTQT